MRKKVGLALGSGGAKGLAHIGVIKILEKNNIPIDFIAGSSIGAMVGGAYAASKNIASMEELVRQASWKQIASMLDFSFKQSILAGEKVKKFIESYSGPISFSELQIPFAAIATDLITGKAVILKEGDVVEAVRASISFPLVFKPVKYKNMLLADGGMSIPVPVSVVREMGADIVIAVNLDESLILDELPKKLGLSRIAYKSLNIIRYHLANLNIKDADVVISPKTGNLGWSKFVGGDKIVKKGEEAAMAKLQEIKNLL